LRLSERSQSSCPYHYVACHRHMEHEQRPCRFSTAAASAPPAARSCRSPPPAREGFEQIAEDEPAIQSASTPLSRKEREEQARVNAAPHPATAAVDEAGEASARHKPAVACPASHATR